MSNAPDSFAAAADAYPGGLTGLADALGESIQVLSNWKSRGVPPNKCKAVERVLGVSVKVLRPNDWQDFWPEPQAA